MDKFKNKYRIPSNRRPNWDYSNNGAYFITICTKNRICNLGEIIVDTHGCAYLRLSDFGRIVKLEWEKSFDLRTELFICEYIIMPNHIHAIVMLEKPEKNTGDGLNADVDTHGRAYLPTNDNKSNFYRQPKSISSFIAGFKSAVNTKIDDYIDENKLNIPKYNRNNHFFQPNYHDHIIRDNAEFDCIQNYIINNPLTWTDDKFYA
jgi:putative transposase